MRISVFVLVVLVHSSLSYQHAPHIRLPFAEVPSLARSGSLAWDAHKHDFAGGLLSSRNRRFEENAQSPCDSASIRKVSVVADGTCRSLAGSQPLMYMGILNTSGTVPLLSYQAWSGQTCTGTPAYSARSIPTNASCFNRGDEFEAWTCNGTACIGRVFSSTAAECDGDPIYQSTVPPLACESSGSSSNSFFTVACNASNYVIFRSYSSTTNPHASTCQGPQTTVAFPSGGCMPSQTQPTRWTCRGVNQSIGLEVFAGKEQGGNYTEQAPLWVDARDGARLYTRIFTNDCLGKGQRAAVVYQQVPYNRAYHRTMVISQWVGYVQANVCTVLALQETRSRYNSTGKFDFFRDSAEDAEDSIQQLAKLPWSNGVVLPQGISAMGIKSMLTSKVNATIRAQAAGISGDSFRDTAVFRGGAVRTDVVLPMLDFTNMSVESVSQNISDHEGPSAWWNGAMFRDYSKVSWPAVMWTGWFDIMQESQLISWRGYREKSEWIMRGMHRLVIDPFGHCGLYGQPKGTLPVNKTAAQDAQTAFFILQTALTSVFKDSTNVLEFSLALAEWRVFISKIPRVVMMVLGSGRQYLAGVDDIPSPRRALRYYLARDGALALSAPTGNESRSYVYDPADPNPTVGGAAFSGEQFGCGPMDQRLRGNRSDAIPFYSPPLTEDTPVVGKMVAHLAVSSSALDTDFVVRVMDVYPTGEEYLVAEGIQRMRWRGGTTRPLPMPADSVVSVDVDLWSTAWVLAAGHRVGVQVTSSSFPAFLPNSNTLVPLATPRFWPLTGVRNVTATNAVHFGVSCLVLPVVDKDDLPELPAIAP
eukprot:TRINITY_DN32487_c0_g1_i1.p1 TRINITY_DN32487_c0_g1~~TRINITY_DN32487_c0_g1_i1.p1  ORF type:complete len:815 (-),score=148.05 TRINITY_DN32487_c0_g1_i1:1088-3532(-)